MANEALLMLLQTNVEAQIRLLNLTSAPEDFLGPATPENRRQRRTEEFARVLNRLRHTPEAGRMNKTVAAADKYAKAARAADRANDPAAEADYKASHSILTSIIIQSSNR